MEAGVVDAGDGVVGHEVVADVAGPTGGVVPQVPAGGSCIEAVLTCTTTPPQRLLLMAVTDVAAAPAAIVVVDDGY